MPMAVSVKKKKPFAFSGQHTVKTCYKDWDGINMASSQIPWPTPMRAIGAQNLLTMPGGVSHSGYLHKKGGSQFSLMKWPLRFIILHKGCMYYFKSSTSPSPQGAFSLNGYNRVMRAAEETTANNVFPFKIVHFSKRHRTWYFSAACEDERKKWMVDLRKEIDFYHDRRDARVASDSNTDLDGFYGSIEKPLEINYTPDTEDDYVVEDEEDEDEDYLKPDEGQSMTGHLMKPPPAYPPPPVPFLQHTDFPHRASPPPLAPTKNLPNPVPRKPAPPLPPPKLPKPDNLVEMDMVNKGPPPPVPLAHLKQKPSPEPHPRLPKGTTPCTAPLILKKKVSTTLGVLSETKPPVPIQGPRTLPICVNLERNLSLMVGPKPSMNPLIPGKKPLEELAKPAMYRPSLAPKPSPSDTKTRGPFQSSPDGQSFRSSVDEVPAHLRKAAPKHEDESDDDYENVQLPDSVFIKTTETSNVEKLFKETCRSPEDGLYCIRNSGTKTSKVLVVWDVGLNKARNYRLFEEDSRIFLEAEVSFPTLAALVEYYYLHPLPNHQSLCLQRPYGYTPPR
ncbi:SH3 domain-binding protein 2 isoform X3 [Paramormyrops kingsleyae]|uniref:SH3 domain-binding protein 2 isoform X3 n=1 Tax=Paramormyrops kingsleyae TaxID=1676925 RepID=UPI000CD5F9CB|nr:SH3 domain-binding protein 2 isoform X3 [Paramormyrops kingsleyae]